jgi:hypothetical protein
LFVFVFWANLSWEEKAGSVGNNDVLNFYMTENTGGAQFCKATVGLPEE